MTQKKHFRVYGIKIAGGIVLLAAIAYVVNVIVNFSQEKPVKHERKIQPVDLVKPPPPPPPPPKVEPPPEPEMEKINEPEPEPEPLPDVPDEQPAGDTGLDAEGTAGTDAFGLAAKKGGHGLLGGGGDPVKRFTSIVHKELKNSLAEIVEEEELQLKHFSVVIKLWISPDGNITKYEVTKAKNYPEIDKILNRLVGKYKKTEVPPPGIEQPFEIEFMSLK